MRREESGGKSEKRKVGIEIRRGEDAAKMEKKN